VSGGEDHTGACGCDAAERPQQLITLDRAFAGNDQLKTNTALQLEAEKIEFKVI
jgi:hypothetical protein